VVTVLYYVALVAIQWVAFVLLSNRATHLERRLV